MNRIDRLIAERGEDSILRKLAEECSELAAAALKLVCVQKGESPMTLLHARAQMVEEMADVLVMTHAARRLLDTGELDQLKKTARRKEERMYERLLEED